MPSHLTRYVFRRLLANEPIVHRRCLRRQAYSLASRAPCTIRPMTQCSGHPTILREQRRTFLNFNFFRRREEGSKEADMDPGIEKMMELAKRQRMRARMPPVEEVAPALNSFFAAKMKKKQPITDTQAQLALQSLQYYLNATKKLQEEDQAYKALLTPKQLGRAAQALLRKTEPLSAAHVELAKLLYETLIDSGFHHGIALSFLAHVQMLSMSGSARQALDIVVAYEQMPHGRSVHGASSLILLEVEPEEEELLDATGDVDAERLGGEGWEVSQAWALILQGFILEGNDAEVQRTLASIRERRLERDPRVSSSMIDLCLTSNDLPGMKQWWDIYRVEASIRAQSRAITGRHLKNILQWCLAHNKLEAGHEIVKEIMATNPPKALWDAIFVWAAGTKKSVDEINRMMSVMEKSNETILDSSEWRVPDITTINGLVKFAISKNDPYMAERFIALGQDRNIEPNARTYVLQMEYRLGVDDVDGALIAYKNLQSMDLSSNQDVPTVNRLIVALCKTQRHDFDTIMNVSGDLSDRRVRFEPETVSTLALLHLNRDEHADVHDLLNTHAFHYSSAERESIRDAIIAFAIDSSTPVSRAWSAYSVVHSIFDETPRPQRTELMTAFFNRERSDMGVRIFQNMRMHSRADTIPTVDTYVAAFMGLAKLRDLESLEVIHNLLKLDFNITVTTYLYNALIIAYTACGKPRKAFGYWDDIVASREGPSYNSIHIALRACEKSPFGDLKAKDLWSLLRRRNIELDHYMWCSYVGALAGNGDTDMAINTVEEAEGKGELEVDAFLLGSLFEGAPGLVKKSEVEAWGRERYPEAWAKLERFEHEVDEAGIKHFAIDRRVTP